MFINYQKDSQGDISVGKLLDINPGGPWVGPWHPCKRSGMAVCTCTSARGQGGQVGAWSSQGGQPSLTQDHLVPVSTNKVGGSCFIPSADL